MFDAVCGGADILRVIKFIWKLLDVVFFIVPIVLIVMISLDFAKSVIAGKDDEMRKNTGIVIKRIIYCVALFLVEPICGLAIDMLGNDAAIDAWQDGSGNNIGWAECIEIAVENDDFSDYEINWNE